MILRRGRVVLPVLATWLVACAPEGGRVAQDAEAAETTPTATSLASLAQQAPAQQTPAPDASAGVDASRRTAIVQAANKVAPAVVNVSVISRETVRARSMWDQMFMGPGAQRRTAGWGSGVIVRDDGLILTNDHVVRNAEKIKVTLSDGRDFDAELVGTDQAADIAVLRIHGDHLPVATLGTSKGLMIGEWAVAIGNPFANYFSDAEPTVTAGVISAVDRNIVPSSNQDGFYLGMIQTDASINPGNSGGPLVNALGQVVGINASIFTRSGGSEGLGFAIPIDRALRIADDLLDHGEVRRAWVGFDVQPVEADEWGRTRGVRVSTVAPGSPGADAGIHQGDRLLAANGKALTAPLDFEAVLLDLRAGDPLSVRVEGRPDPVSLTAAALPSVTAERVTVLQDIQLISVTPQVRAERGIASEQGALVTSISDRLAGQLGIQNGDVLVQVNRARVTSADDAKRIFEGIRGQGTVRLYLERNGGYIIRDLYWR